MKKDFSSQMWGKHTAQVLLALSLWFFSALCFGATQRMFLPVQGFSVPAGGSASAAALCLDVGADSPNPQSLFNLAPASLGDVRVKVAGRSEMSLQQAIDSRLLEIRGGFGYSSVVFHSLAPSEEMQVTVRTNSVLIPEGRHTTEDLLGLPQLSRDAPKVDQYGLWNARTVHAAKKAGVPTESFTQSGYIADPLSLTGAADWVRRQAAQGKAGRSFILQRIVSKRTQTPIYVLFTDKSPPRVFKGNESLVDAGKAIRADWGSSDVNGRPRIVLTGQPSLFADDLDLDAARLTLEVSAGGAGGGSNGASYFSFTPPPGGGPPGNNYVYPGGPWSIAAAKRQDGTLSASQDIPNRGVATVVSKTYSLLGRMAAAVRSTISFYSDDLATAEKVELLEDFEREVNAAVKQAFVEEPDLREKEGKVPRLIVIIDKDAIEKTFIVDIQIDTQSAEARVASAE